MARILIIEDEIAIAETVLYALRLDGFEAQHCLLAGAGLQRLRDENFDLLILDVGLPDMSGFEVCRELRRSSQLPVIFLTARDGEIDRVLGLELGADDYVVKPFSPRELVARVRARLRRTLAKSDSGDWRQCGTFEHDPHGQRIRYAGVDLVLTRYQYRLLAALLARPGAIISREHLMNDVWRDALDTVDRTVDTHVKTLRAKLHAVNADAQPIQTHRGLGYCLKVQ